MGSRRERHGGSNSSAFWERDGLKSSSSCSKGPIDFDWCGEGAIKAAKSYVRRSKRWVIEMDLKSFFDGDDHDV